MGCVNWGDVFWLLAFDPLKSITDMQALAHGGLPALAPLFLWKVHDFNHIDN